VLWGPAEAQAHLWPGATWALAPSGPTAWLGQRDWRRIPPADLVVFLHQQRPLRRVRAVTTILDTQPLRHNRGALDRRLKLAFLRRVARTSEHVLTISEHARASIVADLGVDPSDITILRLPVDRAMAARIAERRAAAEPEEVALYVGLLLPHKNVERLVEAFGQTELRRRGGTLRLVGGRERAAGFAAGLTDEQRSYVEVIDRCSDAELEQHYAEALLVVQPSLEEGWGLPVAEALSAGIEVAATSAGAVPEAARGCAEMFDPTSVAAMAAAIDRTDARALATRDDRGRALSGAYLTGAATARDLAHQVLAVVDRCLP
jgi:glycosyltransferase involved in cell wall biosynthesis